METNELFIFKDKRNPEPSNKMHVEPIRTVLPTYILLTEEPSEGGPITVFKPGGRLKYFEIIYLT